MELGARERRSEGQSAKSKGVRLKGKAVSAKSKAFGAGSEENCEFRIADFEFTED